MERELELFHKVKKEFDNLAGTLALSRTEFQEFFDLNEAETQRIIRNLISTDRYELKAEFDDFSGKEIERLQIRQDYARNYWVKAELIEEEFAILLEIGKLLGTPFNTSMKHLYMRDGHLYRLDLRNQRLSLLPETINVFLQLTELNLQNNQLTKLPESIGQLKHLRRLDLDNNSLQFLPGSIGNLKALEELWIRNNQLDELPQSLQKLKNLQICALQGNEALSESRRRTFERPIKRIVEKPEREQERTKRFEGRYITARDEYLLKICILGTPNELKTRFIRRYVEGKFDANYLPTLGVDITTKRIQVDGHDIKLILVDTAGQTFFGKLRPGYYRGASACVVICALDDQGSFDAVRDWLAEFYEYFPSASIPIALVGIPSRSPQVLTKEEKQVKTLAKERKQREAKPTSWFRIVIQRFRLSSHFRNLKRRIKTGRDELRRKKRDRTGPEEARKLAQDLGITYFEVNEDDSLAIEEVFLQITRKILATHA